MRYLIFLFLVSGCTIFQKTEPKKQIYWEKPGASQAEFNADFGFCRAQAFSVPGAMSNLFQVVLVQTSCMQGRGWYQVER
jgi:hypothetical protein